jgi:tRNA(Ile)-lysidine synthase
MKFSDFDASLSFLKGKDVYVGFSGGSDSLFITMLLDHFREKHKFNLTAIHFEHGIRGKDSVDDMEFCKEFCAHNGIKIVVESLKLSRNTKNLECVAREKRLKYYKENLPNGSVLVLGHHMDDLIENLLIRMMRGSNLSGLNGLREFTQYNNCGYIVYRPLLSHRKEEIKKFLSDFGQEWRTDSTNLESDHLRNFIRNEILEKLYENYENSYKGIFRCIENISEDIDFIEDYVDGIYQKLKGQETVSVFELRSLDKCIRSRIIKKMVEQRHPEVNLTKGFYAEFDKMLFSDNVQPRRISIGSSMISFIKKRIKFD